MTTDTGPKMGTSELLRSLGLFVDGPARWGNPVGSRSPGVFVVELPGGADRAPTDAVAIRRWVERIPAMRVDGEEATPQTVASKLSTYWLSGEPILFVGRSARAIGPRVTSMYDTLLGESRPYSGGHWLKALSVLRDLRVWWAETDAHEEFEDAILSVVAERNDGKVPFANRQPSAAVGSGIENGLRIEGVGTVPSNRPGAPAVKRRATSTTARKPTTRKAAGSSRPAPAPTYISAEGLERLGSELENLRTNVRPEVIARVKSARELGDLKENGDYEYARKEQSFVEGRIQALEALMRTGVVVEDVPTEDGARLGSTVVVESDGEKQTYMLVGSAEADPKSGRISNVSPVGRALLGTRSGDEVTVQLPNTIVRYVIREVR
jgi:transcription elongation factor GreA